uniref:Kinesin-like protein n=1 Tax=Syphacia muris TaxID=451379 RepID=A0A0N5ADV5_9BILA
MTDCIKVAVRGRPFNSKELAEGTNECLQYYVDSNQLAVNGAFFAFDMIFDPLCSQANVYDACAAPLVEKLFNGSFCTKLPTLCTIFQNELVYWKINVLLITLGYNCTIIAYGQTGSGKTYTIGTEETEKSMTSEGKGIIPRIIDAILCQVNNSAASYSVSLSMLEIYDEKILDLLSSKKNVLQVREKNGVTYVKNLTCELVTDLETAMKQLKKGGMMRSKGETAMNLKSSRSHAILTIYLDKVSTEPREKTFKSKLSLVDLAGSERLNKTLSKGKRLREGIKINSGLLALGNVISALAEQGSNSGYIPYRDSKITRLLQDSLGGNSYTVMIACVSPANSNAEETLSTLRYANRAKNIKNHPIVNIDPSYRVVQDLRSQLAAVQRELTIYKTGKHGITNDVLGFRNLDALHELQMKYDNLVNENHCAHLQLVEAMTENSQIIVQLSALGKERDRLKELLDHVRRILHAHRDQIDATNYLQEIMQMLQCERNLAEENSLVAKEEAEERAVATNEQPHKHHTIEVDELKAKLISVQREEDELILKLKGNISQNKCTEKLRRKVQDLEGEIHVNRRQLSELLKLEKDKAKLQEKVSKLSNEVAKMKKLRVKMANQMQSEETKFRRLKISMEREITKIQNQGKKREAHMVREAALSKQRLMVYQQKYEEVNAFSRRLQQQLRAAAFLDKELKLAFSAAEAEMRYKVLIKQQENSSGCHRNLTLQLECISEEPPKKKGISSDRKCITSCAEAKQEQIENLEKEINLRNIELQKLQQKFNEVNNDICNEKRWDSISSLLCAKIALKRIFAEVVKERREVLEKEWLLEQMKKQKEEAEMKFNAIKLDYEKQLKDERKIADKLKLDLVRVEHIGAQKDEKCLNQSMPFEDFENVNNVTYYVTPLSRKRRRHLGNSKTPTLRSRNQYCFQKFDETFDQSTSNVGADIKIDENCNSTFIIERNDNHVDDHKLVVPVIEDESSEMCLKRLKK